MEDLFRRYRKKIQQVSTDFVRSFIHDVNWNARLIGIKGARGVGKTTLLLQYIKLNYSENLETALYVSLDSFGFKDKTLVDLADEFVRHGGKYLFLDEVHKYANWAQELKNIYDDHLELKVVFTGSSLLEILNSRADLSRRAIIYHMQGLSFREYLELETGKKIEQYPLEAILKDHVKIAGLINDKIKPFRYFNSYLKQGYYPFYKEEPDLYEQRIEEVINMMLEVELPLLRGIDIGLVPKIKQLLTIISESVPFVPNIAALSQKMDMHRTTLLSYLHYLQEVGLTIHLQKEAHGNTKLQKPAKVYLENTNLMFVLSSLNINTGNVRETFFANQLSQKNKLSYHEKTDFLINNTYAFEIGGKDKSKKQIKGLKNAFVVADNIEYGYQNKIPLWLFGFLY
ncbi:AAA family ATPase [Psychroflexus sp. CAK57W]|uniref:ATP-binding protein n=1 Tax=Psychroflexus curvus TaxID=2873595 RepID=UPI001CCC9373|nr:AAA family ATPase [Psychroflexus curvus]MBZ9786714.1 AAA family ATPase [Psychroflexus curvus]